MVLLLPLLPIGQKWMNTQHQPKSARIVPQGSSRVTQPSARRVLWARLWAIHWVGASSGI